MTLSIIVPVFNTKDYLPACLGSILSQSFSDFEVLLVDDGSTDGSGDVCDEYALKDSRIHVFHKKNGGVSSARNLALNHARGTWISFVDSDDELLPNGLSELVAGITKDIDLVMLGFVYSSNWEKGSPITTKEGKIISRDEAILSLLNYTGRSYQGYAFAKLFRRDLIKRAHLLFNPGIAIKEDTLFVVDYICYSSQKVLFSNTPVYYYNVRRPSSAMATVDESYNPKYLTSFEATIQINRLVEATFPKEIKLLYFSREEVMNRVYRILGNMLKHNAVDMRVVSQLRKRACQEVGISHYIGFEFRRDLRRLKRFLNKVFKTNFDV